jgi:hypothetical protein
MWVMSWVSNVLVSFDMTDLDTANELNRWLAEDAPQREDSGIRGVGLLGDLVGIEASPWRGPKFPECRLWGGTLNKADLGAVIAKFESLPWQVPAAAQIFIQDQEQSYFRLWMIRNGRADQYAPPPPGDDTAW